MNKNIKIIKKKFVTAKTTCTSLTAHIMPRPHACQDTDIFSFELGCLN